MEWWKFLILIIGSYLIGNIFFARIISKAKHYDINKKGSGNPGTMNVLRNLGFGMGLLTLVLDMLKGIIPAIVGFYLFGGQSAADFRLLSGIYFRFFIDLRVVKVLR